METGATLTVGTGCTRLDPQTVMCAGFTAAAYFELRDGDDALELADAPAEHVPILASGGAGADTLRGCGLCVPDFQGEGGDDVLTSSGRAFLYGGGGNDTLRGSEGRQELIGGSGNDVISGGEDADLIHPGSGLDSVDGGGGTDQLWYSGPTPVVVDLRRGVATGLGRDTLVGIENVEGSHRRDVLIGDADANRLDGSDGSDIIRGGGGADFLEGDEDYYRINFSDTLYGGPGDDRLAGHGGDDVLDGGEGRDRLQGGDGADYLRTADG